MLNTTGIPTIARPRVTGWIICLLAAFVALISSPVPSFAGPDGCTCQFSDPKWQANGTKAACTAWVQPGGTSCTVEFAGVSADPALVSKITGGNAQAYRAESFSVLLQYLRFLNERNKDGLYDAKFIRSALPIFMRGAYLRTPVLASSLESLTEMDRDIESFSDKYSNQIRDVFVGNKEGFSTELGSGSFLVGRNYIILSHPAGRLLTRYAPDELQ